MLRTLAALARSTHPGPTLAVTIVALGIGLGVGLDPLRLLFLGLAVLANQASVGLSNDWIDAERDRSVGRTDKPVAAGLVGRRVAGATSVGLVVVALLLTLPLGPAATAVHALFIGSAWAYNAGLKNSIVSVLPYIVSFGVLPLVVTLSLPDPALAAWWALGAGALLGVSAHFANVLPDLEADRATGIRGLPHRFSRRAAGLVIAVALVAASALVVFAPERPVTLPFGLGFVLTIAFALQSVRLTTTGQPTRAVFQFIIAAALLNVVLLVLNGSTVALAT